MSLAIATSAEAGRLYVAAAAIAEGEEVLRARPCAWAPTWPCAREHVTDQEVAVLRRCPGPGPPPGAADDLTSETISTLRACWLLAVRAALLSRTDPSTWRQLLALEDHGSVRAPPQQQIVDALGSRLAEAVRGATADVPTADEPPGGSSAAEACGKGPASRLLGIILVNAFGTRDAPHEQVSLPTPSHT